MLAPEVDAKLSAQFRAHAHALISVVRATLHEHFDWIRERLPRTVQTNEPGRSAVLYAVLLWLADRHRRPIRLLEIGASAGLNLHADCFAYAVGDETFG